MTAWALNARIAAPAIGTVTQAAGGAGRRNVLRSMSFSMDNSSALAPIAIVVRDGATGVGPIIWQSYFLWSSNAGENYRTYLIGSANTAMTIEFVAADPLAGVFEAVSANGLVI